MNTNFHITLSRIWKKINNLTKTVTFTFFIVIALNFLFVFGIDINHISKLKFLKKRKRLKESLVILLLLL